MSEDRATKRPWEIGYTTGCVYQIHEIVNGKRTKLPVITLMGDAKDAAQIVSEHNTHARLVKALAETFEDKLFWHTQGCVKPPAIDTCVCGYEDFLALIAEAEGLEIPEEGE